jgi:pseudouridine-5'-phosphate glycosidase
VAGAGVATVIDRFVTSRDVSAALEGGRPVVAIETSVIGQGLPHPRNLECIERMSGAIGAQGALPAWIGVVDGAIDVGLTGEELARFVVPGAATKVARRDLPMALANGTLGATTVSAAIWAAATAGIAVVATGGIGGVHSGTLDVSADLLELARTPVLLVCSGPKSIVDPVATAEKLEELGVAVVGYRCEHLPFFFAREADVDLEHRADTPTDVAVIANARAEIAARSAILLCNPVPLSFAMDPTEVAEATRACEAEARRREIHGKGRTPFLLSCMAQRTEGRSLEANLALLEANAALAAEVAVALVAPPATDP